MGNKYIEDFCTRCNKETIHRVFKRFAWRGKRNSRSRYYQKRKVTYCLTCQKRVIVNTTPHARTRVHLQKH